MTAHDIRDLLSIIGLMAAIAGIEKAIEWLIHWLGKR